jgi:hypothetical protein
MHDVETGWVDQYHRNADACFQIRAIGAAGNHDIGTPRADYVHFMHSVFETMRDDAQIRALDVLAGNVEEQIAQTADADGPDTGALRGVEWGRAHGGGSLVVEDSVADSVENTMAVAVKVTVTIRKLEAEPASHYALVVSGFETRDFTYEIM